MTARQRRFLIASAVLLAAIAFMWSSPPARVTSTQVPTTGFPSDHDDVAPAQDQAQLQAATPPSPMPTVPEPFRQTSARGHYALPLQAISGLPPSAAPGTRIELWVTWDRPITKGPRLHRLMRDVSVAEIVGGEDPLSIPVVILSLPAKKVSDMIWADRYGVLSAIILDAQASLP